MAKELKYTDFIRVDGKVVCDSDGKIRKAQEIAEKTEYKDYKKWTVKERACLYDIVAQKMKNPSRWISFESVKKNFKGAGYSGIRPVHLQLMKEYVRYGDRDLAIKGASLSQMKNAKYRKID